MMMVMRMIMVMEVLVVTYAGIIVTVLMSCR